MRMDDMIIPGARIYFPSDNLLPKASDDMLTFAVIRDADTIPDYLSTKVVSGSLPRLVFSKKLPLR